MRTIHDFDSFDRLPSFNDFFMTYFWLEKITERENEQKSSKIIAMRLARSMSLTKNFKDSDPLHKVRWGSPATSGLFRPPPVTPGDLKEVIGGRLYEFDLLNLFVLHTINFV